MARGRSGRRAGGRGSSSVSDRPRRRRYNLRATRSRRMRMLGGNVTGRCYCLLSDEEFRKRLAALFVKNEAKALKVSSVDLHKETNRASHHTEEYEKDDLIVRRGQAFDLSIKFDRPINKDVDTIILQFTTGARPRENKGSLLKIPLLSKKKTPRNARDWKVDKVDIREDKITASVVPFSRAIVGSYELFVETRKEGDDEINRYEDEGENDIYVLFNAWCKEDPVYMEDEKERNEYVLNDVGRVWVGSVYNNRGRPWNFGQFDDPCLDAALTLLDKAEIGDTGRGSVVAVLRAISALTNSNDDDGVLEGRWERPYLKGRKPWEWSGSVAILKQYMETDKPVKYGQCWVFSAVSTTLCRALGIPTRSVTNFASAHDNDCSMTIDKHWDEDGEPADLDDDSVWNFHVWNESFLRRLDLPAGYDGWQAHDATPQEYSGGVMRCGPASLKAIKEGHVYLCYDAGFVFSEVNGDKINWKVDSEGNMEVSSIDRNSIGKCISTKAVGSANRNDVTHLYKYPEGSDKEREVVRFVNRFSTRRSEGIYEPNPSRDVDFKLLLPTKSSVTDDIEVTMVIKNNSNEKRTVKGRMSVLTAYYTGVPAKRLKGEATEKEIRAKQEERIVIKVTKQEYQKLLNGEPDFQVCANYKVLETNQRWATTDPFSLSTPPISIKVPDEIHPDDTYTGTVSFTNLLDIKLTGASIRVEGSRAVTPQVFEPKKAIGPKETISFEFEIKPRRRGCREVEATFSSDQLCGVDESLEFKVT